MEGAIIMEDVRFELDCDVENTHFHDELEILYVLSGRIAVMLTGNNFVLGPEELVVFNPFEHHEHYREAGNHTLSLFVSSQILRDAKMGIIRCNSMIDQEQADYFILLRAKIAVLYQEYMDTAGFRELSIRSQLYALLAVLKQQFEEKNRNGKEDPDMDRMQKALLYVQEHFMEQINLQDVADKVFLSKGHLSKEFQKQMGVHFSDYLRKLRTNRAAHLLCTTEQTITDIALACGFSNTNTMILNFRQEYQMTPGDFRKENKVSLSRAPLQEKAESVSYMPLLKYAVMEENFQPLTKKQQALIRADVDLKANKGEYPLCHQEIIFIGLARELLMENMRNAVRRAVRQLHFRYGVVSGMLDDSMDIYHEEEQGQPYLSFTYLDIVLDFLMSIGLKPCLEFGNMPGRLIAGNPNIYGSSFINLPSDMGKWKVLVEGVIRHLLERYGAEECRTWRYTAMNAVYTSYHLFSEEDYLDYYCETYRSIKKYLPDARINGWTLDSGFVRLDGGKKLIYFLDYCQKNACMPDEFAFQMFQTDYTDISLPMAEQRIVQGGGVQKKEPVSVSQNPDILSEDLRLVRALLDQHGGKGRPLYASRWNSTTWQGELGNDTCFKAAFIFKGYLENSDKTTGLCYAGLTDITERSLTNVGVFSGNPGLMTYQGIPKAGFYAYQLLNYMDQILAARGDGYVVTRSPDRKRIQIALYHYCHYNPDTHLDYALPPEEQGTYERYYGFVDPGIKSIQLMLAGFLEGEYEKESFQIDREHGSSYDLWMNMGAPEMVTDQQYEYLDCMSKPRYQYEKFHMKASDNLLLSASLEPHEVRMICIRKK